MDKQSENDVSPNSREDTPNNQELGKTTFLSSKKEKSIAYMFHDIYPYCSGI